MSHAGHEHGVRTRSIFKLFLIKPSHYDDDGYVIQWKRTLIPSNSLAALYGIATDCARRWVLGEDVEFRITVLDETCSHVVPRTIIREIAAAGGKGLVALVGVQSNQYPRAVDIARPLRAAGIPVCIGGFHAAGSLAMLHEPQPEIREAWDLGISIFAGEAEGRLEEVLRDAWAGQLKPLYDYRDDLPELEGTPGPFLPVETLRLNAILQTSFDAGRGCPFQCSFCTIINVQGRKSRHRSADDVEAIVRKNHAQGVRFFFISDDNFARNRNWESIFDRLIALRAEGIDVKLSLQVDTLCHRIPNFVEKAGRAGVIHVFIGLETIAPDNLAAAKKKQNRITEYRTMLQAWKKIRATTVCGYIIGFPHDTAERVRRDIEIMKRELPVDLIEFFVLTPLPGSEDHQILHRKGIAMDPDLNKYDTEHVTTAHPLMSADEWRGAFRDAWRAYYDMDHIETIMRRGVASGIPARRVVENTFRFYTSIVVEGMHPLQAGVSRRKYRRDRRPGLPRESVFTFYPRLAWEQLRKQWHTWRIARQFEALRQRIESDPGRATYTDIALTPLAVEDAGGLEMFNATESAKQAVERARRSPTPQAWTKAAEPEAAEPMATATPA